MKNITASGPLRRWRTIDLLTCAFLGAAFGVAYWAWNLVYKAPSEVVSAGFPPLGALFTWPWLVAGIVGMLVIRRPGAALFTEVIASLVSMLVGTQWGATTLVSGIVQGLGVELGFALFGYLSFRWMPLFVGGFLGGAFEAVYEWYSFWQAWGFGYRIAYLFLLGGCVAIFGSLLAVGLTRALASAGALNPFPPGQEVRERQTV